MGGQSCGKGISLCRNAKSISILVSIFYKNDAQSQLNVPVRRLLTQNSSQNCGSRFPPRRHRRTFLVLGGYPYALDLLG